jgi:hypothetical protein
MSKFLEALVRSEGKSCAGKLKFPREDSAVRSAADMIRKKGNGEVFEHYKCAFCDGWHIGHRTSFDWIPDSHKSYTLLLIQYECKCGVTHITSTVMSNRILLHFPAILVAKEHDAMCRKCKGIDTGREIARKLVPLADVPEDSTETVESLWDANTMVLGTLQESLEEENQRLRLAVRNMTGDNLCWIEDPEVGKALPRDEFMQSCDRYWHQLQAEKGVVPPGCRTIAQLEARILELEETNGKLKGIVQNLAEKLAELLPEEK